MGRAFVAKLAAKGARDPEALAAWIGRRKMGKAAFQRLAKAGQDEATEDRRAEARVRPGGRLARDLTGLSDREIGRVLGRLTGDESSRVAAELDRRDTAARLPGARTDLIGISDEELGARLGTASESERAAITAEADRRDLLAGLFPGGHLAADLTTADDDTLGQAIQHARPEEAERISAEFDRRYPPEPPPAPSTAANPVDALLADRAALDAYMSPMPDPDGWGSLADDAEFAAQAARLASPSTHGDEDERNDHADEAGAQRFSRAQGRQMYAEHVTRQYLDAEDATRGYLLNPQARAQGVDPVSLFSGPAHVAYARASEELVRWWQENARVTQAEFIEQATGTPSAEAERARTAAQDAHLRWKGGSR